MIGIAGGESDCAIAGKIGRHRGTVGREIRRNGGRELYRAYAAQANAEDRARRPRESWWVTRPELFEMVFDLMKTFGWSAEQVSGWLRKAFSDDSTRWVSHESIYQALFVQAKAGLKNEIAAMMRSGRTRRRPRTAKARENGFVAGMVNISGRPAEAEDRAVPGHW
ncbi:MAG: IS30 family transposase, partial [Acidimicrobiales bacterium]